jgi:hypothetical protein
VPGSESTTRKSWLNALGTTNVASAAILYAFAATFVLLKAIGAVTPAARPRAGATHFQVGWRLTSRILGRS